jgi:hypothetical protein
MSGAAEWRCFHCDEVFATVEGAREHFGASEIAEPACKIDMAEYRRLENQQASCHAECCEEAKRYFAMQADHARALIREEQKGYDKGLKDGKNEDRDTLASWMISQGYATGHGDSVEGLLGELEGQIEAAKKREPIVVDIGAAFAALQASPELADAMNEIIGGKALVEAQNEVEALQAELTRLRADIARKDEALKVFAAAKYGSGFHLTHLEAARAALQPPAPGSKSFQDRVGDWMLACFGEEIAGDKQERNHRFIEEALELVQACGCTQSEAHQLVDYVFERPSGVIAQEAGGVAVTFAALCNAWNLNGDFCAETELVRIWTKVETIRAKQASKPKHSPLPVAASLSDKGGES